MGIQFNPPPGWPQPPKKDWMPPPGWKPDPAWPPAPQGWIWYRHVGLPRWLVTAGVVIVFGLAGAAYTYIQGDEESDNAPQVGECAHKVGDNEIKKVDCDSSEADFRVTSRKEGSADGNTVCATDPVATAIYEFDAQSHGVSMKSFVLCMAEN